MNVKSIERKGNEATVVVEIDKELMESGVNKAYMKARKSIQLPGFRKGKAPRKMMELLDAQVDKMRDAYGIRGRDMNEVLCHHDDIMGDDGNA